MDFLSIRTMLFTPGNRPERFEKAKEMNADGVIIDLEDAISLVDKEKARESVIDYFKHSSPRKTFLRCLRINSIKTPAGLKDISAIIDNKIVPDAILIPKTEYPAEIIILETLLKPTNFSFIALIETAVGLQNASAIVQCSTNVKALCFGGADFAADLGASLSWEPMLLAREQLVCASAKAGIALFDVPYLNFHEKDNSLLIEETKRVKALGFSGKLAIHPKHIQPILDAFTPSLEEIEHAKRIIEIYKKANGNACEIDGKMIDVPVVRSAQRILSLADR